MCGCGTRFGMTRRRAVLTMLNREKRPRVPPRGRMARDQTMDNTPAQLDEAALKAHPGYGWPDDADGGPSPGSSTGGHQVRRPGYAATARLARPPAATTHTPPPRWRRGNHAGRRQIPPHRALRDHGAPERLANALAVAALRRRVLEELPTSVAFPQLIRFRFP